MNRLSILACTLALSAGSHAWAQQAEPHASHHPENAAAAAPAKAPESATATEHADHQSASDAPALDAQIEAMHAMHQKMMAA
jgi:hypothetical protein